MPFTWVTAGDVRYDTVRRAAGRRPSFGRQPTAGPPSRLAPCVVGVPDGELDVEQRLVVAVGIEGEVIVDFLAWLCGDRDLLVVCSLGQHFVEVLHWIRSDGDIDS